MPDAQGSPTASRRIVAAFVLLPLVAPGCASRPPAVSPGGVLTIGVSTTGVGAPAPTFSVTVDSQRNEAGGSRAEPIKPDGGIVTFRDLDDGAYVVVLSVPSRCAADGGTRRQVVVNPRRTTAVRFNVRCQ